jgi:sodium-dependent phosphate cotransporter
VTNTDFVAPPGRPARGGQVAGAARALAVVALLYFFLVAVNGLGAGFRALGEGVLESFFRATENPFVGLMVGILATTLVQSSSVTTAMIVGLVAAPLNPLPVANAVPMIMGANIGTTVTNTVASLAHMGRREEFRRAFAVATVHDFFNYLSVLILLPLELATGFLRHSAELLAGLVGGLSGAEYESPIRGLIKAGGAPIEAGLSLVTPSERAFAIAYIVVSAILIFVTLLGIVRVMRASMQSRVEALVSRALARSPLIAMAVGVIATVMVQSSSITTSLLVPLAGAGLLTMRQALPITLGANIGTTVTALLAALAATGANAQAGLTIALVHLLFNLTGTGMILPFPSIRQVPLSVAGWLSGLAVRSRVWTVVFVAALFYGLPALLAALGFLWQ